MFKSQVFLCSYEGKKKQTKKKKKVRFLHNFVSSEAAALEKAPTTKTHKRQQPQETVPSQAAHAACREVGIKNEMLPYLAALSFFLCEKCFILGHSQGGGGGVPLTDPMGAKM